MKGSFFGRRTMEYREWMSKSRVGRNPFRCLSCVCVFAKLTSHLFCSFIGWNDLWNSPNCNKSNLKNSLLFAFGLI